MRSQDNPPFPSGVCAANRSVKIGSAVCLVLALMFCSSCRDPSPRTTKKTDPQSRLQAASSALSIYLADFDGTFPPFTEATRLRAALRPYVADETIHYAVLEGESDSQPPDPVKHWEWNPKVAGVNLSNIPDPAKVLTFFDSEPRSLKRLVATADGQVRTVLRDSWFDLKDEMDKGLPATVNPSLPSESAERTATRLHWPQGWKHASKLLLLYGKSSTELKKIGEPIAVRFIPNNSPWNEEQYSGWLENHHIYSWRQEGLQLTLNPTRNTSEPVAAITVGVDASTKKIDLITIGIDSHAAADWALSVDDAAYLIGADHPPLKTYYYKAPFGGFELLSVYKARGAYLAIRSSVDQLFSHSRATDFETGKQTTTTAIANGVNLSTLKVKSLYLGPRRTKFSFYSINQPDVDDLTNLRLGSVQIPSGGRR